MVSSLDWLWEYLASTPLAQTVREDVWLYPVLETAHLLGLGLVFGSIVAFDLRVLGWHRDLSIARLGQHLLPWVWIGFVLNAASGVLLFLSDATDFASNMAFQMKIGLILLAGLNAAMFQTRAMRDAATWDRDVLAPLGARTMAVASLVLWTAIVVAGRMIAYIK